MSDDLFPADEPRPQPAAFMEMAIGLLEADPHALDGAKAMIPSTQTLIETFPHLAAVEFRDLDVAGPDGAVPARLYRVPGEAASDGFV